MAVMKHDAELALDAHAVLGEGCLWDAGAQRLIWVDITQGQVHRSDVASGRTESTSVGQHVGAVALRRDKPGLALALRDGYGLLTDAGVEIIAPVCAENPKVRMNDGKPDRAGRFWAGTMAYDQAPGAGTLYRLDADRTATTMLQGVTISNGLDWTPDDRLMYYIDTPTHRVDAFAFDAERGLLGERRPVVEIPRGEGSPDGMTLDADGGLWVAHWGGSRVCHYLPDGRLDCEVLLPVSQVSCCCFGGPDLDTLFITTASSGLSPEQLAAEPHAGGVFACRPGATGRPPFRYGG